MQIMPWKKSFLAAQPNATGCMQVKRHCSWWCSSSGGHSKQRKPAKRRSSQHPSAHKGAKNGVRLSLRTAASLQKHCPVARKARVKQVRPWTYPSMVYVPLCTKLVMSDANRELRFPLDILHCHSLPPACWKRGAKANWLAVS